MSTFSGIAMLAPEISKKRSVVMPPSHNFPGTSRGLLAING